MEEKMSSVPPGMEEIIAAKVAALFDHIEAIRTDGAKKLGDDLWDAVLEIAHKYGVEV